MANPFRLPMALRALRNLVSRPATRRYPAEVRARFPGVRGVVELDLDSCVFCGLCARRCPSAALTVSREQGSFAIEHLRCIGCGACLDACNKHSLRWAAQAPRVYSREEAGAEGEAAAGRQAWKKPAAA